AIAHLVRLGKKRHGIEGAIVREQRLVDVPHDLVDERGRAHRDVERRRLADRRDLEDAAHPRGLVGGASGRWGEEGRDEKGRGEKNTMHEHVWLAWRERFVRVRVVDERQSSRFPRFTVGGYTRGMSRADWRARAGTVFTTEKRPAGGSRGMVVTNHPLATAAGAEML